ncbi:MAG TPA: AfsA-related hotdog domain-containing protein [Thermoleophilaceae bacterium]|jgi:hypothetical protein
MTGSVSPIRPAPGAPAEGAVEAGYGLTFERAMPRDLVHKAAIEQVLLTDLKPLGDDEFAFAAQLPRAHRLFNDTEHGLHDAMAILEAGRQGVTLGVHELARVPRESQFVLGELSLTVHDREGLRVGPEPTRLVGHSLTSDWRYIKGELVSLRLGGDVYLDGRPVMAIAGMGGFMNDRMYRLLRRRQRPRGDFQPGPGPADAALPREVGRRDPANVVITPPVAPDGDPRRLRAQVVVNQTHHTFFDHPLDHVPAMLLVEAMRQAAVASAAGAIGLDPGAAVVTRCRAAYGRYAELEPAIGCDVDLEEPESADGATTVTARLTMSQLGKQLGEGTLELAFPGGS